MAATTIAMAPPHLSFAVFLLLPLVVSAVSGLTPDQSLFLASISSSGSDCRGRIGECLASDEFDIGTEVIRRILRHSSYYISYGALMRDTVPCSRRGASYYNCRPGANANPYSRSCSTITRCRQ